MNKNPIRRAYPTTKSGESIGRHFKGMGAWNDNIYVNWDVYDIFGNLLYVLPLYGDEPVLPNQEAFESKTNTYILWGGIIAVGLIAYSALKK